MRWLFGVALGLLALGCDPSFSVTGTVVEKGSGAAIEGAEIRVTCGKAVSKKDKSDASGKFRVRGSTGIIPNDPCDMVVDKAGYEPAKPKVEACGSQWTDCRRQLGNVELTRK